MKITGIDFTTYSVSDLARSIEFFRDVVGMDLKASGDTWAELWAGNDALVLGQWGFDPKKVGSNLCIAIGVADIKAATSELKSKGVKFDDSNGEMFWETPVCFGATFYDPDGNKVSLHQKK
jgi:catechol 2,3-dioxygenase-like lactoylglutathione lyase family enzyme